MKAKPIIAAVLSAGLLAGPLAGCAQQGAYGSTEGGYGVGGMGTKQTAGTVLGGVVGGLAGSRFGGGAGKLAMVGVGTLLGAALGNAAGASLDRADVAAAERAQQQAYAAPTGSTIRWNNPANNNWGSYTPVRDGTGPGGEYCREYQTTLSIDGQIQRGTGTACRQPDGTWRVVGG